MKSTAIEKGIVIVQNVDKKYKILDKTIHVLKNISFEIRRGEVLAIMGPSGSGKTTLLNLIGGLDVPTKGKIYVNNKNLATLNEGEQIYFRKFVVGFVFQSFNLIPTLTAYENIELALLVTKMNDSVRKERINYLLQLVDLQERAEHKPDELSEGEIQRIAIARALANQPSIVLADEPTANLDHDTATQLMFNIKEINEKTDQTFFIATHDFSILENVDRILILENGQISEKSKIFP